MPKTDWEKHIERRTKNIGFITRSGAFKEPTPGEKTAALYREIASWQETIGTKPYSLGVEYCEPKGHGVNLKATRDLGEVIYGNNYDRAVIAYVNTPMDPEGILKSQGINVSKYEWVKMNIWQAFKHWISGGKIKKF